MFGVRSFAATTFASTGNDETFVLVTGNSSTISIGDVTISGVAEHPVTGNAVTGSTGSVTVTAGAVVTVDGSAVTASIGDTTLSGAANFSVTGNQVTISVGDVTPAAAANTSVTGSQMGTVATGTVTITADCVVIPTGSSITVQTTSAGVVTWNDINVNASQTWTDVAA